MVDGVVCTFRIPFGHSALVDLLEYVLEDLQYSRYICLNSDDWEPQLRNALSLAVASCGWALQKKVMGTGQMAFASQETVERYVNANLRMSQLAGTEKRMFVDELGRMCYTLQ